MLHGRVDQNSSSSKKSLLVYFHTTQFRAHQDLLIDIIWSKFISLYCTRSPSVDLKEQIKEVKRQAKKEIRTIAS